MLPTRISAARFFIERLSTKTSFYARSPLVICSEIKGLPACLTLRESFFIRARWLAVLGHRSDHWSP